MTKTVDLTPTWSGILPLLIEGARSDAYSARQASLLELRRMAAMADVYVAEQWLKAPPVGVTAEELEKRQAALSKAKSALRRATEAAELEAMSPDERKRHNAKVEQISVDEE